MKGNSARGKRVPLKTWFDVSPDRAKQILDTTQRAENLGPLNKRSVFRKACSMKEKPSHFHSHS
jgi:hypothetical protein